MAIYKQNNIFEQLEYMIKAWYPIIYLTTFEYERISSKIKGIVDKLSQRHYNLFAWNHVDGLIIDKKNITDKEDPEEVLKYISEYDKPAVFVLEDFHEYIEETDIKIRIRQLAEKIKFESKHIIFISSVLNLPTELEKYVTVLDIPLPDRDDLKKVLDKVSSDAKVTIDKNLEKKLIDSALGMTVMEADLAFSLAAVKDNLAGNAPQTVSMEKEQIIKKSGLLDYYQINEDFKNIGGMENLKDWLMKRRLAFDFSAQLFRLPEPKGVLMLGVPGCGKSLMAKAISSLWNMPLLRLDIGKVFQGIIGSSEENIRRAISTTEAVAPCILWIDEIEKGLSGIQSSGSTDGGTSSRIFSTILTWMQEKTAPVFVVATANDISMMPPELLRKGRFDEIFFVDLPNLDDRKSIFDIHLMKRNQKFDEGCINRLAKDSIGFNGAEIEECINDAMFTAYSDNPNAPKLTIDHLIKSIESIVPLSRTMNQQIDSLRKWATSRAKPAGSLNTEELPSTDQTIALAPTEKERNRSFDL